MIFIIVIIAATIIIIIVSIAFPSSSSSVRLLPSPFGPSEHMLTCSHIQKPSPVLLPHEFPMMLTSSRFKHVL